MNELEYELSQLGVITINDLEHSTVLELLLHIIESHNFTVETLDKLDKNLVAVVDKALQIMVENGQLTEMLAENVYQLIMTRIGVKKNIEEYRYYAVLRDGTLDWAPAIQQAINDGVTHLVFDHQASYFVSPAMGADGNDLLDEDNIKYCVLIDGKQGLTIEGKNGAKIVYDYSLTHCPNIFKIINSSDITIEGLSFEGNANRTTSQDNTPLYSGSAVKCKNSTHILIQNCQSLNVHYAYLMMNCEGVRVKNCFNRHQYTAKLPHQSTNIPYGFVQCHSCKNYVIEECTHYGGCRDGDIGIFGGGGEQAYVIRNQLYNFDYDKRDTDHTGHYGAQAICNDQGCTNAIIRENYIESYFDGIDMKADTRNTICENNILKGCKNSILDRQGEAPHIYQTQFNTIRGNKIILNDTNDRYADTDYRLNGMYYMAGILCENRQGCWVENNEIVYDFDNLRVQEPIVGIFYSQENINWDYQYPSVIKGNQIVYTVGRVASGLVRHAPSSSTGIHLKNCRQVNVLNNSVNGSVSAGVDYFGIKCEGTLDYIRIRDNLFQLSANSHPYYTEADTTVSHLISDIKGEKRGLSGIIETIGRKEEVRRILTDRFSLNVDYSTVGMFLLNSGNNFIITIKCASDFAGLRYINATYYVTKTPSDVSYQLIDGVCQGYDVAFFNTGYGCDLRIKTDIQIPNQCFYLEVVATQYSEIGFNEMVGD